MLLARDERFRLPTIAALGALWGVAVAAGGAAAFFVFG
jgi:hypothetical protein